MADTSASLLQRLRDPADRDSWRRLVDLYSPLIRGWLHRAGDLQPADADDLAQDVLAVVVRRFGEFAHNQRPGAFRTWLRTICINCLRDHWKKSRPTADATVLDQLADPNSGLSREWDAEHDRHVVRQMLELIRPEFEAATWAAFRGVALDSRPPKEVAAELGVTVNAVFIAKSRVLKRLREESADLVEC